MRTGREAMPIASVVAGVEGGCGESLAKFIATNTSQMSRALDIPVGELCPRMQN